MAEGSTSSKGFAKVFSKSIFRTKEKVLQSLGKGDKTTDDAFDEHVANFHKQQATAAKLQKELKNYITCVKAMSTASKSFYDTVKETYEQEWTGYTELFSAVEHLSILWDDYIRKLSDDIQMPLATYIQRFPDSRTKISKRGRKLIDYDSTRHNLDTVQGAKKKDEGKIAKANEEMESARKIYDDLNNDLHEELPGLYDSRRSFYATNFQALFTAECKFQEECAKLKTTLGDAADRLGKECDGQGDVFYGKKQFSTSQSNASNDDSETSAVRLGDGEPGQGLTKFYNVAIPNDVNNDKVSDTERKSSPRGSNPNSELVSIDSQQVQRNAPDPEAGGPSHQSPEECSSIGPETRVDSDSESEPTDGDCSDKGCPSSREPPDSLNISDKIVLLSTAPPDAKNVPVSVEYEGDKAEGSLKGVDLAQPDPAPRPPTRNKMAVSVITVRHNQSEDEVLSEITESAEKSDDNATGEAELTDQAAARKSITVINFGSTDQFPASEADSDVDIEVSHQENHKEAVSFPLRNGNVSDEGRNKRKSQEETYEPVTVGAQTRAESDDDDEFMEDEAEVKVVPDKRSSSHSAASKTGEPVYSVAAETEDIYKVPTSNEPVENMGENMLYKVKATHAYAGEDVDELTFETGDTIRVIPFDDPEDQDEGWLMGIKEGSTEKGVFPANFTKKLNISLDK